MCENVEKIEKLNTKQESALNMMILGKGAEEISEKLKININTIYRWKKSYTFKQALRNKQDIIFDDLTAQIGAKGMGAIETLYDLMLNANNENNRLKASMFIVDKILQVKDNETIRKIEEIEYELQGGNENEKL